MSSRRKILGLGVVLILLTGPFMGFESGGTAQAGHIDPQHWWGAPVDDDTHLPTGDFGRHFRVSLQVDAVGLEGVQNLPVQVILDLKELLAHQADYPAQQGSGGRLTLSGFHLDLDSFLLREVDEQGQPVSDHYLPVMVERGSVEADGSFHPARDPVVTVRWTMPGPTEGPRYFHVYFDSMHNQPGPGPEFPAREELPLVTSIGPGRGTTHFIPLAPLPGAQGTNEPRRAYVTALHDNTVVAFHEYTQGIPDPSPVEQVTLAQAGDTHEYRLGDHGSISSGGSVMVVSDRPVLAEALSVHPADRSQFVPNDFIPSGDGGFLGTRFLGTPAMSEQWHVFCPMLAATDGDCRVSINGGSPTAMTTNAVRTQTMLADQPASVQTTDGSAVLVQRTQDGDTHGLTAWPAVDGPHVSKQFIGHAGEGDWFAVVASQSDTCVLVFSSGSGNFLTQDRPPNHWCLDQGPTVERMNTKRWPSGEDHATGGLQMTAFSGAGFSLTSGSHARDSNLVVPQSSDGGRTYQAYVPVDGDGNTIGQVVVFALYDGTSVEATRHGGGSRESPAMLAGERRNLDLDPGLWTIRGDRPIVVAWINHRTQDYGAFAPGFTDAAEVEVLGADYVGYALSLELEGSSFMQREPGDRVSFTALVTNRAQGAHGHGLPDTAHISMRVPGDDWDPGFDLTSRSLDAGDSGAFSMNVRIPESVERGSGVTIPIRVSSGNNPDLLVETSLQINFVVRRGVEVREATGNTDQVVAHEESASYQVQVFNRGSAPDSFVMQFVCPPEGWEQRIVSMDLGQHEQHEEVRCDDPAGIRTSMIGPREHVSFIVEMTAGEDVRQASRTVTRVGATSMSDQSETDSLRLSTIAGAQRSFRVLVDEPTRTVAPGGMTTFNLTVLNEAEVNEELRVEVHSALPHGWDEAPEVIWVEEDSSLERVNHVIPIEAQGSATLSLTRKVPEDARALDLSLDRVRMQSQFDRDTAASDTALRVLVEALRGVEASVEGPARAVPPGEVSSFTLVLDSVGNVNQSVHVHPVLPDAWVATNEDEDQGPWEVGVSASQRVEFPVLVTPDATTPAGVGTGRVDFEVTGSGFPSLLVGVDFDVDERHSVHVEGDTVRLDSGRRVELEVPIQNTGNVPLALSAQWEGFPEWDASFESLGLEPGQQGVLSAWFRVPPDATGQDGFSATLNVLHGSRTISSTEWEFMINAPRLEAQIEEIRALSDDQANYRVSVTNTGLDVARNVSVLLEDLEEGTLDRFLILQVRPGATAVANLLGPADAEGLRVRVIADHDPQGLHFMVLETGLEDRSLPAPGFLVVVLVLLIGFGLFGRNKRRDVL